MISHSLSEFQRAARMRWPNATVEGDGAWCLLVSCYENRGCWLFQTELEGIVELDELKNCGHVACRGKWGHSLVRLTPIYAQQSSFRMPGDRER